MSRQTNTNELKLGLNKTARNTSVKGWKGTETSTNTHEVTIHLENIQDAIVKYISVSDGCVGCVAWLTSKQILKALQEKPTSLIVQYESYLKVGLKSTNKSLMEQYGMIQRFDIKDYSNLCSKNVHTMDRLKSNGTKAKKRYFRSLLHHKFIVFLKRDTNTKQLYPESFLTGSCNLTETSKTSLENVIYVRDSKLAKVYFAEWQSLYESSNTVLA